MIMLVKMRVGEGIMSETVRFGVSIDERLLDSFDTLIGAKGYSNRSEAVRDLIRNALVDDQWSHDDEEEMVGTVSLVYNHHTRELSDKLTEHQHSHHQNIVSALHVHLKAQNCLEGVGLKGKAKEIRRLAKELIGTKGVKHGRLMTKTSGQDIL